MTKSDLKYIVRKHLPGASIEEGSGGEYIIHTNLREANNTEELVAFDGDTSPEEPTT